MGEKKHSPQTKGDSVLEEGRVTGQVEQLYLTQSWIRSVNTPKTNQTKTFKS